MCSTITANTRSHLCSNKRIIVSLTELPANCTLCQSHKQFPSITRTSRLLTPRSLSQVIIPLAPRCGWHPQESIYPKGTGPPSSLEAKNPATFSVSGYFATPEHPEDLSPIYGSFLLTWISLKCFTASEVLVSLTKQTKCAKGRTSTGSAVFCSQDSYWRAWLRLNQLPKKLNSKPFGCPNKTSSFLQPTALNWKEKVPAFENWKHIKLK